MRASWVILTQGDRPKDLAAAITSIVDSAATEDEIVVVGNGYDPASIEGVTTLGLPENIGIPAGRNAGIEVASGELICFLDDDARLLGPDFGSKLKHLFEADPTLGIVTFRITDVASGVSQRRHVPRVGNVDPEASSEVTSFLGGACAVRSEVLDRVGLLPGEFFYALEETDLAWRALDEGWSIRYEADLAVHHPATTPSRHGDYLRRTARNRVWLARRRLPALLAPIYVCNWMLLSLARCRSISEVRQVLAGTAEGLRTEAGERAPISWSTVVRMARLGRPPII